MCQGESSCRFHHFPTDGAAVALSRSLHICEPVYFTIHIHSVCVTKITLGLSVTTIGGDTKGIPPPTVLRRDRPPRILIYFS